MRIVWRVMAIFAVSALSLTTPTAVGGPLLEAASDFTRVKAVFVGPIPADIEVGRNNTVGL